MSEARLSDKLWAEAQRRAQIIGPLARKNTVSVVDAGEAAQKLGLSERTIYNLVQRWHTSGGAIPALVTKNQRTDKGKNRLAPNIDRLISQAIKDSYFSRQKPRMTDLMMAIKELCLKEKLKPPSINTVKARVKKLNHENTGSARSKSTGEAEKKVPRIDLESNNLDALKIIKHFSDIEGW